MRVRSGPMARRSISRSRVLYICGWGRSGTTLIDRMLGEAPDFLSVGELRSLWDADPSVHRCGCGEVVEGCPLWGPLLTSMEAETGYTSCAVRSMRDEVARTRHLPRLYWKARRRKQHAPAAVAHYGDVLGRLYHALLAASRSSVIVDSSKHPAEALLLASRADVDLTVLHVVRDPRAVAYSWERPETSVPGEGEVDRPPRLHPGRSAAWWTAWNASIEMLIKPRLGQAYVAVRYEDVMEEPARHLDQVLGRFGLTSNNLPFLSNDEIRLSPSHTVAGNPSRMRTGVVHLAVDRRWEQNMDPKELRRATLPAIPLMGHYGYSVRPPAEVQPIGSQ